MQWKEGHKNCFMGAIENQLHVHIYWHNGWILQMLLGDLTWLILKFIRDESGIRKRYQTTLLI